MKTIMKDIKKFHSDDRDRDEALRPLVKAISALVEAEKAQLEWFKSHLNCATTADLKNTEERIVMKLSEVKAIVNRSAGESKEAFAEIGTKIADLQKQIGDLIAGNGDPDITDEEFLTNLNQLKTDTAALAAIVPNTNPPA